ncbi:MAG: cyoC [Verrucomicrobiales bacterium]|nr:cyoC [Verrucomicrobiales bacterium]
MEIPYTVSARPDTGLYNAKVGIWLFLASEVMLFGGLFSSYVFLRIGADFSWPFHELNVLPGFINTMVLIASSVTVVAAWAALKARRYGWFQINMIITIACSLAFMGIKSYEYYGKFMHYSVILKDGTILDGHPAHASEEHAGDKITLTEVREITLAPAWSTLNFLNNRRVAEGSRPFASVPEGQHVKVRLPSTGAETELTKEWFKEIKKQYWELRNARSELATLTARLEAPRIRAEELRKTGEGENKVEVDYRRVESLLKDYAEGKKENNNKIAELAQKVKSLETAHPDVVGDTLTLQVVGNPLVFLVGEKNLQTYSPTQIVFRDTTILNGKMTGDAIPFNIDAIDLRKVKKPEESMAWKYFPQLKGNYEKHREEKTAEYIKKHPDHAGNYVEVGDWQHEVLRIPLHEMLSEEDAHAYLHDEAHTVQINRADRQFYSNFSPSRSPYYAIYFLMTGLHGLHVIGGAIVLTYFLVTGRRMYRTNPEHLANRVEVGGLFWHFVDLVWIFLFPVFYLM